jgi:hypothetical protein
MPIGYCALYERALFFADPRKTSVIVTYPLLLFTVVVVAICAYRLCGCLSAAWIAAAVTLSSDRIFIWMVGGNPRAFAFPVVVSALAALCFGKPLWLCAITVAATLFYPTAGMLSGIALAFYLLFLPAALRGDAAAWSLKKRAAVVVSTALISACLLLPNVLRMRDFGQMVKLAEVTEFPEAGTEGRLGNQVSRDWMRQAARTFLPKSQPFVALRSFGGSHRYFVMFVLVACLAGGVLLWREDGAAWRMGLLIPASVVGYLLAAALYPQLYLPTRFLDYGLPLTAIIFFAASLRRLGGRLVGEGRQARLLAMCCAVVLVCFLGGGSISMSTGLDTLDSQTIVALEKIEQLPHDVLIVGWPTDELVNGIPYFAERSVLVNSESHQPYHRQYVLEMRRRTRAVIAGYFARDAEPLGRLRTEYGATHLLLNRDHFRAAPPVHFAPFTEDIRRLSYRADISDVESMARSSEAVVFSTDRYCLINIEKVLESW